MAKLQKWDPGRGALQLSNLRRALQDEGMVTAWWSDVPGTRYEEHTHPFAESRWVLSGYLRITVGGESMELGPGDRLDVPAGTPHATQVIGLAPAIYVTGTTDRSIPPKYALMGQ